jgi:3-hydroxyacyl-CoA dehydrogenase / enoyl-CoA hydratase / 3-hydroxybutyryl-CoA epimerase
MTWRMDDEGVLRVVFEGPREKVNLLGRAVLEELGRVLDDTRVRSDLRGVLFQSARPGMFLAGMDIEEIVHVADSHLAAEGARFGQAVFQKIADLRVPTVCAIGGTCLGGGTELALACHFRLAADDPAVRIGLPEVKLGIIPGFGGTQRLPRLIGLIPALDLILTGRTLDARRAKSLGLVDSVVPPDYLEREGLALIRRAGAKGIGAVRAAIGRRRGVLDRVLEHAPPVRTLVLARARRSTAAKVDPRDYPAPFRALEACEAAFVRPPTVGLDLEARIVGQLVPHPTARNLMWLFRTQAALTSGDTAISTAPPRRVRRVAVLGAGIMGGGIAQLAADKGLPVRLKDVRYEAILTALRTARDLWARRTRGKNAGREMAQKMAFISPTLEPTGLRHVDLVIEAVVENLEVKRQVLAEIEPRIGERAVFASNTSSIPIGEIAARALHPERVVGLHFFNPVHRMPLVEVIAGRETSPEAVATVRAAAIKLGKTPVLVRDGPGFLVNRILTFYVNEALRLWVEGCSIEALDRAMCAFGMPMGPFAMLDEVGLDTARHVGDVLSAALGSRAAGPGEVLERLVSSGRLGRKSGNGFYHYRDGRRGGSREREVRKLSGTAAGRDLPPETLQERMVLTMVNEAVICLEDAVVREPRDVDVALVLGTGFPPFRGGLLRHADALGLAVVVDRLARLAEAHGDRFRPAEGLKARVRQQKRFYEA